MTKRGFNPCLPSWEYIPDGEPHAFGDRVHVYGSHDRFNGRAFCLNDYACWSAPVGDLADWRYEGVIYWTARDGPALGRIGVPDFTNEWKEHSADIAIPDGIQALYFAYMGEG